MLDTIEKLLILQDRDRKLVHIAAELAHIGPERVVLRAQATWTQNQLETFKHQVRQIEADRKRLELDVESKKQQIEKYANQQLQTRKNEEYRALAHEIELCKEAIFKIEDEEIALMEQAEHAQKEVIRAAHEANEAKKRVDEQVGLLDQREQNLKEEMASLQKGRTELAMAVDEIARDRYERLFKSKGENVVVGVNHGVCGGCHMKLPPQILVSCQSEEAFVSCSHCGRILYYTRDMALAATD